MPNRSLPSQSSVALRNAILRGVMARRGYDRAEAEVLLRRAEWIAGRIVHAYRAERPCRPGARSGMTCIRGTAGCDVDHEFEDGS